MMMANTLKLTNIGNSVGVILPKEILNKYEEKIRLANLNPSEGKGYFAEFCHGLKQSSYLSV